MPEELHANISFYLFSIFGATHAEYTLIILLLFFICYLFLNLIEIVLDDHCLQDRMSIFMLSIK